MAAGGHIGNVTWKQIDIKSCVIPLFLLILAWRIHIWHRFCILTSSTIKIQDGRLWPYWKCSLNVNGHKNPCNSTFPTKCGIESPFLAWFLYFESKYQNARWPPYTNSVFFCFGPYNPYYITCWISHQKLVFSNMCLFPGIISRILTSPNIKIQDGRRWSYWKCASKMILEAGVIPLFHSNVSHRAHFWNHFVFWQVWMYIYIYILYLQGTL